MNFIVAKKQTRTIIQILTKIYLPVPIMYGGIHWINTFRNVGYEVGYDKKGKYVEVWLDDTEINNQENLNKKIFSIISNI